MSQVIDLKPILLSHPSGERLDQAISKITKYLDIDRSDNCLLVRILVGDLIANQPTDTDPSRK